MRLAATFALLAVVSSAAALQQSNDANFSVWERLLERSSGPTDKTSVPTMMMDDHMQMSDKGPQRPGDTARAEAIVAQAQRVIDHYRNVDDAQLDGYTPFFPTGKMGEEVHYVSLRYSGAEQHAVDYAHPGSLLYERTPAGMKIVGVMYGAPAASTSAELDARAPISIAPWHRHVDFCGAPKGTPIAEQMGPSARFGLEGSIHTPAACKEAAGLWLPVVFGWMTHVYPERPAADIWGGAKMTMEHHDGAMSM